ncbi:MAG: LuxR C-terminal-related transcriptional regulator, partial [Acidimicrobiales bacterium]
VPELVARLDPDVVVSGFEPVSVAAGLAATLPRHVPVLVWTWSRRRDDLVTVLRAGGRGVLHKGAEPFEIVTALRCLATGGTAYPHGWEQAIMTLLDYAPLSGRRRRDDGEGLTPRQHEVVGLVAGGCSNKEIARRLGIAHQTVKNHLHHLMVKLELTSRVQLCTWAVTQGATVAPPPGELAG